MHPPIDSRQLIAFVTLARTGSYTKTARELFLTHSAISHSMRALEGEVGCLLLDRVDKKVALTEAGEAFLHHARRALQESQNARAAIENLNKWGFQRLRLGVGPLMSSTFLPRVLTELRQEHPHLLIEMLHWSSEAPISFIEANRVELLVGEKTQFEHEIDFIPLLDCRYHLIVPRDHAWAKLGHAVRLELPKEPCILGRKQSPGRRLIEKYFAVENITLNIIAEIENPEVIKEMVGAGLGFGILPECFVRAELAAGSLVSLPPGKRDLRQSWGLIQRQGKRLKPIESRFTELLCSYSDVATKPRRRSNVTAT
jgi:DNA-binding transcriptional LysR family regulator